MKLILAALMAAGLGRAQDAPVVRETVEVKEKAPESNVDLSAAPARDDQLFHQLGAGIDVGQHEGGGKSVEIRRFGFNLDHGGVNGGLKVLVDDMGQNQGTQGHGQGYLGSLKALSPELIDQVIVVDGPFRAEYGDFSGLGVVHIRQKESLPDEFTARIQGGNFDTGRAFLSWSPAAVRGDSYLAYEGAYTNGPFVNPLGYRRDNVNGNYTRSLSESQRLGFRFLFGRNNFRSSGQLPLDLVNSGALDRFGYLDPRDGGHSKLETASSYYTRSFTNGDSLRIDGFISRSLFDLYSNFTFYLHDPIHGDAFQQHDSRLQEGSNVQWFHVHRIGGIAATLTAGANYHDNQINVGPHVHVTNGAGFAQESISLLHDRLLVSGGVRFDEFRFGVDGQAQSAGKWQGKGSATLTPSRRIPVSFHLNYGRGINSADARAVTQRPDQPRVATTDFYQSGVSASFRRVSLGADFFVIDHSHEQVYVPDDGSFEFKGPSRAYGYESKLSVEVTRHISLSGGLTKIGNAFYRGGDHRVYVDSAPHFSANAAVTVSAWRNWSGALRMRAINHYRLDGEDPSVTAGGHTVFDLGLVRRLSRNVDVNLNLNNLTDRDYWETQNYFESRVSPAAPVVARIHATPAYPLTAVAGVTLRFGGK